MILIKNAMAAVGTSQVLVEKHCRGFSVLEHLFVLLGAFRKGPSDGKIISDQMTDK